MRTATVYYSSIRHASAFLFFSRSVNYEFWLVYYVHAPVWKEPNRYSKYKKKMASYCLNHPNSSYVLVISAYKTGYTFVDEPTTGEKERERRHTKMNSFLSGIICGTRTLLSHTCEAFIWAIACFFLYDVYFALCMASRFSLRTLFPLSLFLWVSRLFIHTWLHKNYTVSSLLCHAQSSVDD